MKVNTARIPDELQPLVKEEMTTQEVALLGHVILKMKLAKVKERLMFWRKNERPKTKD